MRLLTILFLCLIQASNAANHASCSDINGTWTGSHKVTTFSGSSTVRKYCLYTATVFATTLTTNQRVNLRVDLTDGIATDSNIHCPTTLRYIYTGSCKNGRLRVSKGTALVTGTILTNDTMDLKIDENDTTNVLKVYRS